LIRFLTVSPDDNVSSRKFKVTIFQTVFIGLRAGWKINTVEIEFFEVLVLKINIMNKKKIPGFSVALVITAMAVYNMSVSTQKENVPDILLENVEALANEVTGGFPACQKKKGDREHGYIPFCVNGVCQNNTWEAKGKLDVNYCNQ
jgi:hypothetical protein